jgi:DNA-directed RNA polymerase specialized sigma24 family protein
VTDAEEPVRLRLDHISTRMTSLHDTSRFVMRYGPAVQKYLLAILRDEHAADDVWQEMMVGSLLKRGGPGTWPGKGHFRDYLRTAARNAALMHLRKANRHPLGALPEDVSGPADRGLDDDWRRSLLEKVWRQLDAGERAGGSNFFHTALRIYTDHDDMDSPTQAKLASERLGRAVTAEAFRQQVSRGKRKMAELILTEVAETVADATAADVEAELVELGLMAFVRDYLPTDWRTKFFSD